MIFIPQFEVWNVADHPIVCDLAISVLANVEARYV